MFKASLETKNFSFEGYGTSEQAARTALFRGLHRHADQCKIDGDVFVKDYIDDIQVQPIRLGVGYRDGALI